MGQTEKAREEIFTDVEEESDTIEVEAIDVNDYCREYLGRSKISDNIRMLGEDKSAFSGLTFDGDILEHCWNDWR